MELQENSSKGIIVLDIDGTITDGRVLSEPTALFLNELIGEGWHLVLATGRTFSFAEPVLSSLLGPLIAVVQNGASVVKIPEGKVIYERLLPKEDILKIIPLFQGKKFGLLVESGARQEDLCYYVESNFSSSEKEYIDFRNSLCPEKWIALKSFDEMPGFEYASCKFFALGDQAEELKKEIQKIANLKVSVIKDPFRKGYHLAQIQHPQTSKYKALKDVGLRKITIAAGDDVNDLEILENASIKIVMESAPKEMLLLADVIGQAPSKNGIIKALKSAIGRL